MRSIPPSGSNSPRPGLLDPGRSFHVSVVHYCNKQLISLGVIGEYIGKIFLETKQRPRYIVSERTEGMSPEDDAH